MTDARLYASRPANRPLSDAKESPTSSSALDVISRPAHAPVAAPMWNLTPQQWRVFLLVGKAMSNKAIAHELNVAESTVKAHVSAIFKLAKCRNRTEAALLSQRVRYGLLDTEETVAMPFVALAGSKSIKHRPHYK